MVFLNINGIDCYYGSTRVLEKVRLSVREKNFVGILGPNGSGKTTLLRSICGSLKPHVGAVLLNDVDIYSMKNVEVAREIAVVPQETSITLNFTALDIVLMGRNPHLTKFEMESKKDVAIAKKSMELTGTWHLADRPVLELSGGEKQRVIIARALAQDSKVLLLDEPTTHLDINHQMEIMDLLKNLSQERELVVLAVFHDFNLAARYCDTAILLNRGRIVSTGSLDAVLTGDNIEKVFQVTVSVKRHPITNSFYIVPISTAKHKTEQSNRIGVHVICGGGTGSLVMRTLLENGFQVTAGVLNLLDDDYETANALRIPVITEAPFSSITEDAYQSNLKMVSKASATVLANIPVGFGNLKNLQAAKMALEKGILTVIIEETNIRERDFTHGEAEKVVGTLKNMGAVTVNSPREALSVICRLEKCDKGGVT